ncbi:unnamed protein product [Lampetra planeri]
MSKSTAKCKNLPVVQSNYDDSMEVVPTTPPDSEGLEMCPAELLQPAQDEEVASHDLPPSVESWRDVANWATLPQACEQMAAIFDGPSNARRRFLLQRWVEAEMPLAFRSTLLVLGQAAVLNILALECPLLLARELGIVLSIVEEADLSSLRVAQGIHLGLCPWPAVVACTGEQMESEAITPQDGAL